MELVDYLDKNGIVNDQNFFDNNSMVLIKMNLAKGIFDYLKENDLIDYIKINLEMKKFYDDFGVDKMHKMILYSSPRNNEYMRDLGIKCSSIEEGIAKVVENYFDDSPKIKINLGNSKEYYLENDFLYLDEKKFSDFIKENLRTINTVVECNFNFPEKFVVPRR